jgi:hypothetical protein
MSPAPVPPNLADNPDAPLSRNPIAFAQNFIDQLLA